jgi:tRNA(His) 5'-end guanylyltransferase
VLPEIHIVARLDGRGFTRLTKEVHHFEAPFDAQPIKFFRWLTTQNLTLWI